MPVIINDFEIVTEPPAPAHQSETPQGNAGVPPSLTPADIERIVRHFEERRDRLIAD